MPTPSQYELTGRKRFIIFTHQWVLTDNFPCDLPPNKIPLSNKPPLFFGTDASVLLFGSRADDSKRGGDIDLYIDTHREDITKIVRAEIAFLADINRKRGDQRIDVLVNYPSRKMHPPIFEIAKQQGIAL